MIQRCHYPKSRSYKYYGAKGITVCDKWRNSFVAFRTWAIEHGFDYGKSRKEQSLDRIDNTIGYSPDNCRFVSHSENCKNTSRNRFYTYNGKTQCLNDWSKELEIPLDTLCNRANKSDDVNFIFDKEKMAHRSNTGIKGISQLKNGRFVVYIDHHYKGSRTTLEAAKSLMEELTHGT